MVLCIMNTFLPIFYPFSAKDCKKSGCSRNYRMLLRNEAASLLLLGPPISQVTQPEQDLPHLLHKSRGLEARLARLYVSLIVLVK